MTARLSVKSHRKGVCGNAGKSALMTWGILSPTMIQKAIMPPKALNKIVSFTQQLGFDHLQSPLSYLDQSVSGLLLERGDGHTDIAMSPDLPKQRSMVA